MGLNIRHLFCFIIILSLGYGKLIAQTDNTFWFAIPKETSQYGSLTATHYVSFKLNALGVKAKVTISMPANPAFPVQTYTVNANSTSIAVLATSFAQFAAIYANPSSVNAASSSGITNNGILIQSDNLIEVYYDYDNNENAQLYTLKGANALGTSFFTPFQTISANLASEAESDIDVVATENNTNIQIVPNGAPVVNVTLNKGQTYSLVATGQSVAAHLALAGAKITSNNPITVTVNDDAIGVSGQTCENVVGDQIVPVGMLGNQYIVSCGQASTQNITAQEIWHDPLRGEQIFVLATQNNTTISFIDTSGAVLHDTLLNAGQEDYFSPDITKPSQNAIVVQATSPVYVFHETGIGCVLGGAILPSLNNCTGSNEVVIYRSSSENDFTMSLMIPYDTSENFIAATQAYQFFSIVYNNGTSYPIPGSWFEPIKNTGWATLTITNRDFPNVLIPQGVAVRLVNTQNFFIMGMTNGSALLTEKYGYLSSFNTITPAALVGGVEQTSITTCYGDTVYLVAQGGLNYDWHYGSVSGPPTYMDNYLSPNPQVFCPPGINNFYVNIQMPLCYVSVNLPVTVTVYNPVKAGFNLNNITGCAPTTVTLTNTTTGANGYVWSVSKNNSADSIFTPSVPMSASMQFTEPNSGFFQNLVTPYKPIVYTYQLKASFDNLCPDSVNKTFTVYPQVIASYFPPDTAGCQPILANFRNKSNGNVTDTSYNWNFGDGGSSSAVTPSHMYYNLTGFDDTVFQVSLVVTSPYDCRDTARTTMNVYPYIQAGFTVDTVAGCSPLTIKITNNAQNKAAISSTVWDFGDGTTRTTGQDTLIHTYPVNISNSNQTYQLSQRVRHPYGNGCSDTLRRLITVYPQTTVSFITNPNTGSVCDSTLVTFTGTASAAVTGYTWTFGDGSSSTLLNVNHLYRNRSNKDTVYHILLNGTSNESCNATALGNITVHPYLEPGFTISEAKICAPGNISITGTSVGGISQYYWNYGDGSALDSLSLNPVHTYQNTGNDSIGEEISLEIKNSGGCVANASRRIVVYPAITASYSRSVLSGCNPLQVTFTNTSSYVNNAMPVAKYFLWNFADSTSSSVTNPVHTFENLSSVNKIYGVNLKATSIFGCTADTTMNITVYAYLNPTFTVSVPTSCAPFEATITNNSSGGISGYTWNFNDGTGTSTSNAGSLEHIYTNNTSGALTRNLNLEVTNSEGCTANYSQPVEVYPQIRAVFTPSSLFGCTPFTVTMGNNSTDLGVVAQTFGWNFGDNTSSSSESPTHTYTNTTAVSESYTISLEVSSQYNCTADTTATIVVYPYLQADFTMNETAGCSPFTVTVNNASLGNVQTYKWSYGDGSATDSHSSAQYTHTFLNTTGNNPSNNVLTRDIQLVVTNSNNFCSDTMTLPVLVYPQVNASYTSNVIEGCNPLTVNFNNTSGPAGVPVSYAWTLGDGSTGSTQNLTHDYTNLNAATQVFPVQMVATSQYQCTDTATGNISVYPFIQAAYTISATSGCSPQVITFQNNSSPGSNGFNWTFGDGNTAKYNSPSFLYSYINNTTAVETFVSKLVVGYNGQCLDTVSNEIEVYPAVVANFTADTLAGCQPLKIQFENTSLNAIKYLWTFGSTDISIENSPQRTFSNFGTVDSVFTVSLEATSMYQCQNSVSKNVVVHPKPKAIFSIGNAISCPPFKLSIANLSEASNDFNWSFGDGNTLTTFNMDTVYHIYDNLTQNPITYTLLLSAETPFHCEDTMTQTIQVYPRVISQFSPDTSGCSPILVNFDNTTIGSSYSVWFLGDGTGSKLSAPSHKYYNNGLNDTTYSVVLHSYSSYGCYDSSMHQVTVYPQPLALFTALPTPLYYPDDSVYINNETNTGNWNYLWTFGDGQSSNLKNPLEHIYTTWGTYEVGLSVTSNHCSDTISQSVLIIPPPPVAIFNTSANGCVPLTVTFSNQSTYSTSYNWNFNDGSASTDQSPTHTYTLAGMYFITLTVTGPGGQAEQIKEVQAYPLPIPSFTYYPSTVLLPSATVNFYNSSQLGVQYLWEFGDNTQSADLSPTHTYTEQGKFNVMLTVWSENQCVASIDSVQAVTVEKGGVISFPNVFKPTGQNNGVYVQTDINIFHPYSVEVTTYNLQIYDRWGELIFESNDVNVGWDGYYKGTLCKADVYIWVAKGRFYNGKAFDMSGDVTLIR